MAAKLEIPDNLGGRQWWWVWHDINMCMCEYAWFSGPFDSEVIAIEFRDTLIHPTSCPGCGVGTPNANDYHIEKI